MMLLVGLILPAVASPIIYLLSKRKKEYGMLLLISTALIVLGLYSYAFFGAGKGGTWMEKYWWISVITPQVKGISFTLFIDGISYLMVLTTIILFIFTTVYAMGYIEERVDIHLALLSLLLTGLTGVFVTANLLAFYVFWEFMLVPSYFIIAKWGYRDPAKIAFLFFIYTHVGALFIILGIGLIAMLTGGAGLEILQFAQYFEAIKPYWGYIFAFLTFGFLVKMAILPVHTWLPPAHSEAPSNMSALLSGIIIEAGAYAILRISYLTVLQSAYRSGIDVTSILYSLTLLGVLTAFYGGFMALKEIDVKRIIAYSSVSHMGYVLAGLSAGTFALLNNYTLLALYGAVFHLIAHAWSKGLFFLVGGSVLHQTHLRDIREMSGLMSKMPYTGICGMISMFSIGGVPPLPCFISEFMIIAGVAGIAQEVPSFLYLAVFLAIATLLSAAYTLRYFWQVFWYKRKEPTEAKEANRWMLAGMIGLAAFVVFLGILPWLFTSLISLP
ncbi:MAG: hypothetical protein DRJ47_05410 [Thermoprotei archaeon]|nr:MAG: hypothetical protein DRJ47_05410 [Thermoprotei archaeon]